MKRCVDTTFLSPLVRADPTAVSLSRKWAQSGDVLATTEINYFEVALGIELTQGRQRKERFSRAWVEILGSVEVLPLSRRATLEAVRRQVRLYAGGQPSPFADLLIAAIAKVGACETLVTRDAAGFRRIGLLPVESH